VAERVSFEAKWRLLAQVGVRCYILISNVSGAVKVAPLQILQFPVVLPHKFQDAEKFNLQFPDFSEITETADKLRWLRYQKGLRQRDVADYAGIDRSTYVHYEEYGKGLYPPEHMEKIAQLFEVPVDMLLDDYNLFLRNGQGNQIKAIRTKLGLTQRQYADKLGVPYVIFLGGDEIAAGVVACKDMKTGEQTKLPFAETLALIQSGLAEKNKGAVILE